MTPVYGADAATALRTWLDTVSLAGGLADLAAEHVAVQGAVGRVLAEPVFARRSTPAFDAAAMDGFALAAEATAAAPISLGADAFAHVDTGDPLPAGADAVVKREDVGVTDGRLELAGPVAPYGNVRQVGEDVARGDLLFPAGRRLRSPDLAVLASVGETELLVRRRPVVAVVPSGDELVPVGTEPTRGQIVDTNSLMLAALVEEVGATAVRLPIVPDDPDRLAEALLDAAATADLVLLLSGSAEGADDHTVTVIERVGRLVVQGVAIKPGHPVALGLTGATPLMGVPGYPVSAVLAFELLAVPLLALLGGRATERRRARATAAAAMASTPLSDEWMRLRLARVGGTLLAVPLRRGAGVLSSLARADALACLPIGSDGVVEGAELEVELLRPLEEIERSLLVGGCTDPIVDELAARFDLVPDCDGSSSGAAALASGRCHLAVLESEDIPAGTTPLRTWDRELVLATAAGNPLRITGADALRRPEVRLANRPPGSGCRRALDRMLSDLALEPEAVTGYRREARSQAAAAAAVAAGAADCAVCSRQAAERAGLDVVPLVERVLALVAASGLEDDTRVSRLCGGLDALEARVRPRH